jgi:hypothetical protein
MAILRTPVELVTIAMNVRTEGMGLKADGERRYGRELWKLAASVRLKWSEIPTDYRHRKVWRFGL